MTYEWPFIFGVRFWAFPERETSEDDAVSEALWSTGAKRSGDTAFVRGPNSCFFRAYTVVARNALTKAPEGWRTPGRFATAQGIANALASWSAAALRRFCAGEGQTSYYSLGAGESGVARVLPAAVQDTHSLFHRARRLS